MAYDDSTESRVLRERLAQAERNEGCLLGACWLVAAVALVGLSGLGYSAVLLPQFFDNATHVLVRFFSALSLGSALCLSLFAGLWLWYRGAANRIHEECRRAVMRVMETRLCTTTATLDLDELEDAPVKILAPMSTASVTAEVQVRKAA
jgi:hypothetical protein